VSSFSNGRRASFNHAPRGTVQHCILQNVSSVLLSVRHEPSLDTLSSGHFNETVNDHWHKTTIRINVNPIEKISAIGFTLHEIVRNDTVQTNTVIFRREPHNLPGCTIITLREARQRRKEKKRDKIGQRVSSVAERRASGGESRAGSEPLPLAAHCL